MIIPLERGALPLGALGRILGVEVPPPDENIVPQRLVTNSKEVSAGDLFCALIGERDGHAFTEEAVKNGAVAILAERTTPAKACHIITPSVRRALADWAIAVTQDEKLLRIGITGSVGKTTVKDAVSAMLATHFFVHATYGNYNNDLGRPFTLLSAPKQCDVIVCEVGINHPGEMTELSAILRPHISVITCIGHAHIGAFGSRERIAAEKREILRHAEGEGTLFVPITEPLLFLLPPNGIQRRAVTPFDAHTCKKYGLSFEETDIPRNLAYAFGKAVGEACRLSEEEIRLGLHRIASLETRRKVYSYHGIRIIDDGYNASPESMLSALLFLASEKRGKRIAVLGDMLELGEKSDSFHHAVGRFAASHADTLFFFGDYAETYAEGASAGGAKQNHILSNDKTTAANEIAACLSEGDSILFKASRALRSEELIACLKHLLD